MLAIPLPDLHALVRGETVVAFVERGTATVGDEVTLGDGGPRPVDRVKAAYTRWADAPIPPGGWTAVVVAVHPSALLDPEAGAARHVLRSIPTGDLAILRVYRDDLPVLSDDAFTARRGAVEGALSR